MAPTAHAHAWFQAFTKSTMGIPAGSDQFGPRQFENPTLVQSGSQTMEEYMADAERLYERFVLEVVDELAQATSPLSEPVPTIAGLKKLKRTTEKIRKVVFLEAQRDFTTLLLTPPPPPRARANRPHLAFRSTMAYPRW